jgi:hypothetical protein
VILYQKRILIYLVELDEDGYDDDDIEVAGACINPE